jgi:hypothetical protein
MMPFRLWGGNHLQQDSELFCLCGRGTGGILQIPNMVTLVRQMSRATASIFITDEPSVSTPVISFFNEYFMMVKMVCLWLFGQPLQGRPNRSLMVRNRGQQTVCIWG